MKKYAILYVIMAVLTFGVAASDPKCEAWNHECNTDERAMHGGAAGFWWPAYWSWHAIEKARGIK